MHKKSWRQGKCISNLIRFFIFFQGKLLFLYSTWYYFFTTAIYFKHVSVFFFFCHFSFDTQKIFFSKKTDMTLIFFYFSPFYFFIQNKILSYYKKGTEWKTTFFLYFFQEFKTHFFWFWQESNFRVLITSCNLLTQKRKTSSFIFSYRKSTQMHLLY